MDTQSCPFCSPDKNDIVYSNALWYARWDDFPATRGHLLVIPFRHCTGYFDTTAEEQTALPEMLFACRKILDLRFSPAGYNIVINIGEAADQRVMHCHVHIIPRYNNAADNPPGGIRKIVLKGRERGAPGQ
jgi:diadenosine tetraphosphate (Ap4A) HIT family hydrolase